MGKQLKIGQDSFSGGTGKRYDSSQLCMSIARFRAHGGRRLGVVCGAQGTFRGHRGVQMEPTGYAGKEGGGGI